MDSLSAAIDPPAELARPLAFLSYARADRPRLERLARALDVYGIDVWWDAHLVGGRKFAGEIEAALNRCDVVIVAWSRDAAASDWVHDEAARGRDMKRLLPLSLDGTAPPMGFRQYHAIDLSDWNGEADARVMTQVLNAFNDLLGQERAKVVVDAPKTWLSRRRLLMGGGVTVGAVAVTGLGVLAVRQMAPPVDKNSVAVLPFANLSGDPQQVYFSDGLAEEVRSVLARDSRLKVMGAESAGKFRTPDSNVLTANIKDIASKLGVAYLLNGSVQRAGDVVRIAASLTDGLTGFTRWSQSFDRPISNIFAIQSEIAGVVSSALAANINTGAADRSVADTHAADTPTVAPANPKDYGGTTNVAAYDNYLRGRALYNKDGGETSDREALSRFEAALKADTGFAAAHAARSRSLSAIANAYAMPEQAAALFEQAIIEAQSAVRLAPDLADAQSTLAQALLFARLDVRGARPAFARAYQLGGNDAPVLSRFGYFSAQTGDFVLAEKAMVRALAIDPLNALIHRTAGLVRIEGRAFAEAIPLLKQSLALEPKLAVSQAALGLIQLNTGKVDEARKSYASEAADSLRLSGLAICDQKLGRFPSAKSYMAELVAKLGDSALYQQAQVQAQWGNLDSGITLLERARAGGDTGVLDMRNDSLLDPLRNLPRFSRLLSNLDLS